MEKHELGRIEPERITREEYLRRQAELEQAKQKYLQRQEEMDRMFSSQKQISATPTSIKTSLDFRTIIAILPAIISLICICLALYSKSSPISVLGCCGFLGVIYLYQRTSAVRLVKAGNKIMARKALLTSFIPLLTAFNAFLYKIVSSATVKGYASTAVEGLKSFRDMLIHISPQHGATVFMLFIATIAICFNAIAIKSFRRVMRLIRLF